MSYDENRMSDLIDGGLHKRNETEMTANDILKNQKNANDASIMAFVSPDGYVWKMILQAMQEYARLKSQEDNKELVEALRKSNVLMTQAHEFNILYPDTLDDDLKSRVLHNNDLISKHTPKG